MRVREQGMQYRRGDDGAMPVSKLVRRMKNLLEIEIGDVWVEGEVSNLRKQASGRSLDWPAAKSGLLGVSDPSGCTILPGPPGMSVPRASAIFASGSRSPRKVSARLSIS